jgi:hypothetical protein
MEAINEQDIEEDAKHDMVTKPALHKLYHEGGKSYFSAKSVSIYEHESQGLGLHLNIAQKDIF